MALKATTNFQKQIIMCILVGNSIYFHCLWKKNQNFALRSGDSKNSMPGLLFFLCLWGKNLEEAILGTGEGSGT